jgi:LCP family protein required for cell wall assembly
VVRRPRPKPLIVAARSLLIGTSVILLAVTGFVWSSYKDLTNGLHLSNSVNAIKPGEQGYVAPGVNGDVNLLLIGLDSRKDMNGNDLPTSLVEDDLHAGSSQIGGYNTNVLILMHIPADGSQVTAFSIPRDDYVERPGGSSTVAGVGTIPDLGKGKIKEAYGDAKAIAETRLVAQGVTDQAKLESMSRDVGREATLRAVQLLTGVHVDHIAEVNLIGFYDIVNAIGNIQVCLKAPAQDPIEDGAGTGINLPAGLQSIDASQALQFVRQRYHLPNGDLDRTHRQQAFLTSVTHKLKSNGVLDDIGKMQALLAVVKNDIVIDDDWNPIDFAMAATNMTGGDTTFYTLPILHTADVPDGSGIRGQTTSVNIVDAAALKKTVTSAFDDDSAAAPPPNKAPTTAAAPTAATPTTTSDITVDNGTDITGLAEQVSGRLFGDGIVVSHTGNGGNVYRSTIRYGSDADAVAQQIADKLGLKDVPSASSSLPANSVVVNIGSDYKTPETPAPSASSPTSGPVVLPTDSGGLSAGGPVNAASEVDGIPCVY